MFIKLDQVNGIFHPANTQVLTGKEPESLSLQSKPLGGFAQYSPNTPTIKISPINNIVKTKL